MHMHYSRDGRAGILNVKVGPCPTRPASRYATVAMKLGSKQPRLRFAHNLNGLGSFRILYTLAMADNRGVVIDRSAHKRHVFCTVTEVTGLSLPSNDDECFR